LATQRDAALGYLSVVLHAHLPFVRHPEYEDFLEEDWLYEAITESYIPLLWVMERLVDDDIDFRLTMSLTPPLVSMLNDELLRGRYAAHLDLLCELAEKEVERTRHLPQFRETAVMYRNQFFAARSDYTQRWNRDLVGAFGRLQREGKLEIIASAATHGFLPVLCVNPAAVRAQILVGVQHYTEVFGRRPRGIWLPECGFYPGLDALVREAGLRFFFVDTHAIHHASSRTRYGPYAPLYCPTGVAAFARDDESSKQVWSSIEGYPGDFDYREFYRDVGFDLDLDYIGPYIHKDGIRVNTGIKYYRITGPTACKEPYLRRSALDKAAVHAGDFMFNRQRQVEWLRSWMDRKPIVVAPYDAELFGHWWFEGPDWLDFLFRRIACDQDSVTLTTPSEYLAELPVNQVEMPGSSSWGYGGYNQVWVNGANDWMYRHLHAAADRMVELAAEFPVAEGLQRRALDQAARELLLAQASDWAFIMTRGTVVPYATQRTKDHLLRFNQLFEMLKAGAVHPGWLSNVEDKDNIFPKLDYRVYRPDYEPWLAAGPGRAAGSERGT
jgi:1,4-alpha-glucan branching enzyme